MMSGDDDGHHHRSHQHPQIRHHEHSPKWETSEDDETSMMTPSLTFPIFSLNPTSSSSPPSIQFSKVNKSEGKVVENRFNDNNGTLNSYSQRKTTSHNHSDQTLSNSHESKYRIFQVNQKVDQMESSSIGLNHVDRDSISYLNNLISTSLTSSVSIRMVVVTETKLTFYASLTMVTYSTPEKVVILTHFQTKTMTLHATSLISSLVTLQETVTSDYSTSLTSLATTSSSLVTSTSLLTPFTSTSSQVTEDLTGIPSLETSPSLYHPQPSSVKSDEISSSPSTTSFSSIEVTSSISLATPSSDVSFFASSVTPTINLFHHLPNEEEDPSLDHDSSREKGEDDETETSVVIILTIIIGRFFIQV
jgi:flagellar biogenesis protein FliO